MSSYFYGEVEGEGGRERKGSWRMEQLESIMKRDSTSQKSHVFMHPFDAGLDYTDDEVNASQERDFECRLFITGTNCGNDTFFLRTRHTDNHEHNTEFNFVRDYLKAVVSTRNHMAAKVTLSRLLTMCFKMSESNRISFSSTIASGLSRNGKNVDFEISDTMVRNSKDIEVTRLKLCVLMHIIFNKVRKHEFLVEKEGSNAFRLFHCRTKHSRDKKPILYAVFSFLLQCCLTGYVVADNWSELRSNKSWDDYRWQNLPLASLTLIYSAILAWPGIVEKNDAFEIYGSIGVLQSMDFCVNAILPTILLFSGFLVIYTQESYIEAVLNTAALLFIPEIDDHLPSLLGFSEENIIKNFLISEAMEEYDHIARHRDEDITPSILLALDKSIGVQFADYYITNIPERGSTPEKGIIYQPHQVNVGTNYDRCSIDPSSFVTSNCLIRKVTWCYTTIYPNTSQPRVGYLKLDLLNGETVEVKKDISVGVTIANEEIEVTDIEKDVRISEIHHELEGVFIITNFQMSNHVLRLRLCGSRNARDFEKAFDYYSLWSLSKSARRRLRQFAAQNPLTRPSSKGMCSKLK